MDHAIKDYWLLLLAIFIPDRTKGGPIPGQEATHLKKIKDSFFDGKNSVFVQITQEMYTWLSASPNLTLEWTLRIFNLRKQIL